MNKYLEKIAEASTSEKSQENNGSTGKRLVGAYAALTGAGIAKNEFDRGNLTGRETLYHGTSEGRAKSILEQGLKPSHGGGISTIAGMDSHNKDLTFLDQRPVVARMYADQQHHIEKGDFRHGNAADDMARLRKSVVPGFSDGKVLKANVPTWKQGLEGHVNPEVAVLKANPFSGMTENQIDNIYQKHVYVHKNPEGLSNTYFKGSKNYAGNSGKEILDYISHNKSRFAKGVGKAALGLGAVGGGSYLFRQGMAKDPSNNAKTN